MLADLPGYGYAEAPLAVVKQMQELVSEYCTGHELLLRVFVLIDSRWVLRAACARA